MSLDSKNKRIKMSAVPPPSLFVVKIDKTSADSPTCFEEDDNLEGDLTSVNTVAAMISPITATATGVTNKLFGGKYIQVRCSTAVISGYVVTVAAALSSGLLQVQHLSNGRAENLSSSQAIGVALEDGAAGTIIKVAISGVCTVLTRNATTSAINFNRGANLLVDGQAGRVSCVAAASNRAVVGTCLSQATLPIAPSAVFPVLVMLRLGFEAT